MGTRTNMLNVRRTLTGAILVALCLAIATGVATKATAPPPAYANFEAAQTNPIRLSADGTRLFAVNTPNNTVTVFDVTTPASPTLLKEIPVGVGPVSVNSLSDDVAWVVNQVSNSISVISVSQGIVTATISAPVEPMDVVFVGSQAYVSCSRSNAIDVFSTASPYTLTATVLVYGGNPRALAVSKDGSTVYAAFALSGNATTIIPDSLAPPQPPPTNPDLPPPPQVSLIVAATDPAWSSVVTYKMPDNDVVGISTGASPAVTGYYSGVGTINLGLGVSPKTGDLWVANTDALNLTFFQPALCGHWVNNRVTHIQVSNGAITPFDLNPSVQYGCAPNSTDLNISLAQPTNVVFDPSGSFMYIAAFGTDRVAKVSSSGTVLGRVEVAQASGSGSNVDPVHKRGPRGLALNAGANTLYCLNRLYNSISVINTSSFSSVSNEILLTDPTPTAVKEGRGFLYDAKLSGTGNGSCASCHVDADMDHIAWNLGNPGGTMNSTVQGTQTILFHPMKGPMTTQTLRGLINLSPYHWRGDKPNLSAFNAAFAELMGGTQLAPGNMALYSTYLNSILFLPNPNENLNRTLPTSLKGIPGNPVNGQSDFVNLALTLGAGGGATCNFCHTSNPGPGSNRLIEPAGPSDPQPFKMPELRNIYQKTLFNAEASQTIDGFGFDHDGNVSGFAGFFKNPSFSSYTANEQLDMSAYGVCFDTGTAPAVGFTLTLTAANVNNSSNQTNWATLQSQAGANIDLIGRGTIQGQIHGLLFQAGSNPPSYTSDTGTVYTQTQLQNFILNNGDTLSFMGVYPGTGSAQY